MHSKMYSNYYLPDGICEEEMADMYEDPRMSGVVPASLHQVNRQPAFCELSDRRHCKIAESIHQPERFAERLHASARLLIQLHVAGSEEPCLA